MQKSAKTANKNDSFSRQYVLSKPDKDASNSKNKSKKWTYGRRPENFSLRKEFYGKRLKKVSMKMANESKFVWKFWCHSTQLFQWSFDEQIDLITLPSIKEEKGNPSFYSTSPFLQKNSSFSCRSLFAKSSHYMSYSVNLIKLGSRYMFPFVVQQGSNFLRKVSDADDADKLFDQIIQSRFLSNYGCSVRHGALQTSDDHCRHCRLQETYRKVSIMSSFCPLVNNFDGFETLLVA